MHPIINTTERASRFNTEDDVDLEGLEARSLAVDELIIVEDGGAVLLIQDGHTQRVSSTLIALPSITSFFFTAEPQQMQ